MNSTKRFLSQTAKTASFAFWEYFRPLFAIARFFKSRFKAPRNLDENNAILHH